MYRELELGMLVKCMPDVAAERILARVQDTNGNLEAAAILIGCACRTLHRWVETLNLRAEVDTIRSKAVHEGVFVSRRGVRMNPSTKARTAA